MIDYTDKINYSRVMDEEATRLISQPKSALRKALYQLEKCLLQIRSPQPPLLRGQGGSLIPKFKGNDITSTEPRQLHNPLFPEKGRASRSA
jgi:hypothetical protein